MGNEFEIVPLRFDKFDMILSGLILTYLRQ